MTSLLVTCRQEVESIIAALTPNDEPHMRFRRSPGHLPLRDQPTGASMRDETRTFQVTLIPRYDLSEFNTTLQLGRARLSVAIRYHIAQGADTNGYQRLTDLTSSDAALIGRALKSPTATYPAGIANVYLDADPDVEKLSDEADVYLMTMEFAILYCADE